MTFVGTLREYQEEAKLRMVDRGKMLLGMVMGAGKTPTTIAAIEQLAHWDEIRRCLVIVPAALKYQWAGEIKTFAPDARVTVIDGTKSERNRQWRVSIGSRYVIVNPESLMNDLGKKPLNGFEAVVIDEATMIKNRTAKRSRFIKRISKSIFYRFALTGQPIENRPEELFSIMEFVDDQVLGGWELFDNTFIVRNRFGRAERFRNLDLINQTMAECMVRYSFDDIKDQMPDVIHQLIPVRFDRKAAALYQKINDNLLMLMQEMLRQGVSTFDLFSHYEGGGDNEVQGQVMNRLLALRMLCGGPHLLRKSADDYLSPHTKAGSSFAAEIDGKGWMTGVTATPKMDACIEYINEVLEEDERNKVVLFSTFKGNLAEFDRRLKYQCVQFHGDMDNKERQAAKERFQKEAKVRVFLSSDAGGYGVDLPQANYLISYDLPWSSGKLEQREARIIRLSSEFSHVTIATFVMAGSIEEYQYALLQEKRKTNEAFIDGKHQSRGVMDLTLDNLSTFLRGCQP